MFWGLSEQDVIVEVKDAELLLLQPAQQDKQV
jgi:hypothetical protein